MLYVIILIVPLFYLLVLDLASFFISDGSGEKLSFKVTVLLSISVLLLILQDMLPSTEEKLPMMGELPLRPQTRDWTVTQCSAVTSLRLYSSHLLHHDLRPGGDQPSGGHAGELPKRPRRWLWSEGSKIRRCGDSAGSRLSQRWVFCKLSTVKNILLSVWKQQLETWVQWKCMCWPNLDHTSHISSWLHAFSEDLNVVFLWGSGCWMGTMQTQQQW